MGMRGLSLMSEVEAGGRRLVGGVTRLLPLGISAASSSSTTQCHLQNVICTVPRPPANEKERSLSSNDQAIQPHHAAAAAYPRFENRSNKLSIGKIVAKTRISSLFSVTVCSHSYSSASLCSIRIKFVIA